MDHDKVQHISNVVANTGAVMTWFAYIWHGLDIYHVQISSLCMIATACVAGMGALINGYDRWKKRGEK
jgi:hypothetical protein